MKVHWTLTAELTYEAEITFIYKKWNHTEVLKFIKLIDNFIETLKTGTIEGKQLKKQPYFSNLQTNFFSL